MKMNHHLRSLIVTAALAVLVAPVSALACHHGHGWCNTKGGVMFNQNDGMYYRVPGKSGMVYRGVDNKLVPVAYCGMHCGHKHKHCYKQTVSVKCEPRAGYWWMTTWMAPSQECYYIVR